jgi:hypothetical protein
MQVKSLSHFTVTTVPLVKTKIYYKYFLSVIKRIINHYIVKILTIKNQKEREREKRTNQLSFNIRKDKGHLYSF